MALGSIHCICRSECAAVSVVRRSAPNPTVSSCPTETASIAAISTLASASRRAIPEVPEWSTAPQPPAAGVRWTEERSTAKERRCSRCNPAFGGGSCPRLPGLGSATGSSGSQQNRPWRFQWSQGVAAGDRCPDLPSPRPSQPVAPQPRMPPRQRRDVGPALISTDSPARRPRQHCGSAAAGGAGGDADPQHRCPAAQLDSSAPGPPSSSGRIESAKSW